MTEQNPNMSNEEIEAAMKARTEKFEKDTWGLRTIYNDPKSFGRRVAYVILGLIVGGILSWLALTTIGTIHGK